MFEWEEVCAAAPDPVSIKQGYQGLPVVEAVMANVCGHDS